MIPALWSRFRKDDKDRQIAHAEKRAEFAKRASEICYAKGDRWKGFRFFQHYVRLLERIEFLK